MSRNIPLRHYRLMLRAPLAVAALVSLLVLLASSVAKAQIKQPGAHPDYSVEVEPHLVFQWVREPLADEGIGVGGRFTIPFLDNGPIDRINNNMGIGFGFDWVHFEDSCWGPWFRGGPRDPRFFPNEDCEANTLHFPVVLQWNFFLTPVISVFGEPGLEIEHTSFNYDWYCNGPGGPICEVDADDTDVEFVFWGGARFMFGDTVGAVVRVGTPYLSVGVTLLL
jgi:hypothetical protein